MKKKRTKCPACGLPIPRVTQGECWAPGMCICDPIEEPVSSHKEPTELKKQAMLATYLCPSCSSDDLMPRLELHGDHTLHCPQCKSAWERTLAGLWRSITDLPKWESQQDSHARCHICKKPIPQEGDDSHLSRFCPGHVMNPSIKIDTFKGWTAGSTIGLAYMPPPDVLADVTIFVTGRQAAIDLVLSAQQSNRVAFKLGPWIVVEREQVQWFPTTCLGNGEYYYVRGELREARGTVVDVNKMLPPSRTHGTFDPNEWDYCVNLRSRRLK